VNEQTLLDEPVVTYTVKDMLSRIDAKLDMGFGSVNTRLDGHDQRLRELESEKRTKETKQVDRRYLISAAAAIVVALAAVISIVLAVH
jgi:hypothetical protein